MDPMITAAEIWTLSRPLLDPLLEGSMDKLREVGSDLTKKTLDALHGFWQRLTRQRPEAAVLARGDGTDEDLKRLIAETLAADPILKQLAETLRQATQVSIHQGKRKVKAGKGGVAIGGDAHSSFTINN